MTMPRLLTSLLAGLGLIGLCTCEPEVVVYDTPTDCLTDADCPDGVCVRGECLPGECTKDADCLALPPTCADPDTMVLRPFGSCDADYHCIYEQIHISCEYGCDLNDGECKNEPCQGVVCQTPPNSCFFAEGTCADGACHYSPRDGVVCDDGDPCTIDDLCSEGACVGRPLPCQSPPDNACIDADTLKRYQPAGYCHDGECVYGLEQVHCEYGCTGTRCENDPCSDVVCNRPLADYCLDPYTARRFNPNGTCAEAQCSYNSVDDHCEFGCLNGACKPDPCGGVTCDQPPAPQCLDSSTRRVFDNFGTCQGGQCSFGHSDITCSVGCASGQCLEDKCLGTNCNDNNPCTTDSCTPTTGACSHTPVSDSRSCTTASGDCPQGKCAGATCVATAGLTCMTEVDYTFCNDLEVQGVCASTGECAVDERTLGEPCADCEANEICLPCDTGWLMIVICIPLGG